MEARKNLMNGLSQMFNSFSFFNKDLSLKKKN